MMDYKAQVVKQEGQINQSKHALVAVCGRCKTGLDTVCGVVGKTVVKASRDPGMQAAFSVGCACCTMTSTIVVVDYFFPFLD